MNLGSVAERVAAIDRSAVAYTAARCLHATDRFATCQACAGLCPVGAITPGPKPGHAPALKADACVGCLACLPVCPTGAFSADDAVAPLLECAARVATGRLEVICQLHPAADRGLAAENTAIRVRGCLAGLGVGALVALAAMGAESIVVRTDACGGCTWAALLPQLERQVAQARHLLGPLGQAGKLSLQAAPPPAVIQRTLLEADNPPLSRRDLFRLVARRGQVVLARAMNETSATGGPHPARERLRLMKALAAFPTKPSAAEAAVPAGAGFATVQVSAACSACGACARACSSGALVYEHVEPANYRLLFHPAHCTGCAACLQACAPAALSLDLQPSFAAIFLQSAPTVLSAGGLVRCASCHTWMAASGKQFCPTCEVRRAHPFGPRPTPGRRKVQL